MASDREQRAMPSDLPSSETRFAVLRTRPVRRGLAVAMLAVGLSMIIAGFVQDSSGRTLLSIVGTAACLLLWWSLSASVRWLLSTPERQLDEFFRSRRQEARSWAYPIEGIAAVVLVSAVFVRYATDDLTVAMVPASIFWSTFIGFGYLSISLPSIRLAWTLPDEF